MLSRKREQDLSDLASSIANFYDPVGMVRPANIAAKAGITYSFGDYGDAFDGLIEHEQGHFHIFINLRNGSNPDTPRARFTFAHELGHYFIDEHRNALLRGKTPSHPSYIDFSSKNPVEQEADYFASSLLLPAERVKADCAKKKFNFGLVSEIAERYKASITATVLKMLTIDKHPIMVVCSVAGKIKWFRYSHDFPFKYLKQPFGVVPKHTLAGAYFGAKEKIDDEFPVMANEWFDYVPDRDIERQFYEKCIYAEKSNFVLSIIWED